MVIITEIQNWSTFKEQKTIEYSALNGSGIITEKRDGNIVMSRVMDFCTHEPTEAGTAYIKPTKDQAS